MSNIFKTHHESLRFTKENKSRPKQITQRLMTTRVTTRDSCRENNRYHNISYIEAINKNPNIFRRNKGMCSELSNQIGAYSPAKNIILRR